MPVLIHRAPARLSPPWLLVEGSAPSPLNSSVPELAARPADA